jgi:glycosyltransferase involved in cell wall biosynthesis
MQLQPTTWQFGKGEEQKPRPFWSVMLPTYRPDPSFLRQALESVLRQALAPNQMQIEVVDDCSPETDVQALVRSIAGERVSFSRTPKNLGLAGCWNTCIERAHGEWVHILHQDDWVLQGFYERFEGLFSKDSHLDAAYARYWLADANGNLVTSSVLEMTQAGEFNGFNDMIATWTRVQCAAVVVKRPTYERVGGYHPDLPYVLDWEMWCRLGARGRWGYVPELGAVYRVHPRSETERLRRNGQTLADMLNGGRIARSHFPPGLQKTTELGFLNAFIGNVLNEASWLYAHGELDVAGKLLKSFRDEALKSNRRWSWRLLKFRVLTKPWRQLYSKV